MAITKAHLIGVAVGVGVAATGFYFYCKNRDKVDQFLRDRGLKIPVRTEKPLESMDDTALAELKEKVEDILAEREAAAKQQAVEPAK